MKCAKHPKLEAESRCVCCQKALCKDCESILGKYPYCPTCANMLVEEVIELIVTRWQIERERRKHPRLHSVISVDVHGEEPALQTQGVLVNVSSGGMGLITHHRLREQTTVTLTFTLPHAAAPLKVQGGVLRTQGIGRKHFFSGIMFMNLGDTHKLIDKYIRQGSFKQYARVDKKVSFL